MLTTARREYLVLAVLLIIFLVSLIPSLLTSRAHVRDGLRRQDITSLKRSLEQFYNEHEYYPPVRQAGPAVDGASCITSLEPDRWPFIEALPHDVRENNGFLYRYCITDANT